MQLIEFIAGIAVLILLHEFGHFIAARLLKVEIEEFGIGFPPRMVTLFERHGTIFSLNWLPLGGFVRPKGENDPEIEGGLAAASPWVRLGVLFAGPLTNILIGIILGTFLFYSIGDLIQEKVLVDFTAPGSPAETAGLQPGDLFISVNGEAIDDMSKLQSIIADNMGTSVIAIIERNGERITLELVPRANPPEGEGPLGVALTNPKKPVSMLTAASRGVIVTFENIRGILALPVRLINGSASPEEGRLVGYKGMYDIYTNLQSPLWFFMIISISLGITNLLPIPALDGGRILLTLPEIIFRRRVPPRFENALHLIGFTALILLLIYINVQDFINPVAIP